MFGEGNYEQSHSSLHLLASAGCDVEQFSQLGVKQMENHIDPYLEKYLAKYDKWLDNGEISNSSRVLPVSESLNTKQWVLLTEQVMSILRDAKTVAVQDCACRTHYKRCDKPMEVCFLLNESGDKAVSDKGARYVDLIEAANILTKANQSGLIHLSLYRPDHEIFALCSCCPCCCHDLQIVKLFERKELLVHSEYAAVTSSEDCMHWMWSLCHGLSCRGNIDGTVKA